MTLFNARLNNTANSTIDSTYFFWMHVGIRCFILCICVQPLAMQCHSMYCYCPVSDCVYGICLCSVAPVCALYSSLFVHLLCCFRYAGITANWLPTWSTHAYERSSLTGLTLGLDSVSDTDCTHTRHLTSVQSAKGGTVNAVYVYVHCLCMWTAHVWERRYKLHTLYDQRE